MEITNNSDLTEMLSTSVEFDNMCRKLSTDVRFEGRLLKGVECVENCRAMSNLTEILSKDVEFNKTCRNMSNVTEKLSKDVDCDGACRKMSKLTKFVGRCRI